MQTFTRLHEKVAFAEIWETSLHLWSLYNVMMLQCEERYVREDVKMIEENGTRSVRRFDLSL